MNQSLRPWLLICLVILFSDCQCQPQIDPQTLQIAVNTAPESLDPRIATSFVASTLAALIHAPLCDFDDALQPRMILAEKIEALSPRRYRIAIKPNLRFHDGTQVRAQDLAYTIKSLNDEDVRSPNAEIYAKHIDHLEVKSNSELLISLKAPHAPFPVDICGLSIMPKSKANTGSGPFRLIAWNTATEVLQLAAADTWFEGAPAIKRIDIHVVRDATTRLLELIDSKTHLIASSIKPPALAVLTKQPHLVAQQRPGVAYSYLAMNMRPGNATAHFAVRKAIAQAIDIDSIIRYKFKGAATRAHGPLPPGHWADDNTLQSLAYNPDAARATLRQAGLLDAKGHAKFSIVLAAGADRFRQSISLIMAESLRKIGIPVEIRVKEWAALFQDIKQGNFSLFSAQWLPVVEPDLMHWVFHSDNIPSGDKGGGNRGGFIHADIDRLLERGRAVPEQNQRRAIYHEVQKILLNELPYVPLWFEDEVAVHDRRLQNYQHARTGSLLNLRYARLMEMP